MRRITAGVFYTKESGRYRGRISLEETGGIFVERFLYCIISGLYTLFDHRFCHRAEDASFFEKTETDCP